MTDIKSDPRAEHGARVALGLALIAVVLICLATGAGAPRYPHLASTVGFALGACLIPVLTAWLVIWLAVVRRAGYRGFKYFLILMVAALAAHIGSARMAVQAADADRQDRALIAEMRGVVDSAAAGRKVDATVRTKGDHGEMERLIKDFTNRAVADQEAYAAEMQALDGDNLLAPEAVATKAGLERNRQHAAQALTVVEKYRKIPRQRIEEFRAEVDASPMSAATKRDFLAGFNEAEAGGLADSDRVWALERGMLTEIQGALDVLARARGHWAVQQGQFAFERPADMAAFNAHVRKLQALGAEQEALRQAMATRSRDGVETLARSLDEPPSR